MHNFAILCPHLGTLLFLTLCAAKLGERTLHAWLCLVAIAMNLFVSKQITLFGLEVTATDSLAVGYLIGYNILQEIYGKKAAREHLLISLFVSGSFVLLSLFQLSYVPNHFDQASQAFKLILSPLPRVVAASFFTFMVIQIFDIVFFGWLREKFEGKNLVLRVFICSLISQNLDTHIFSFLALYRSVPHLYHVIWVSLTFKLLVIILSLPMVGCAKAFMRLPIPRFKVLEKFIIH